MDLVDPSRNMADPLDLVPNSAHISGCYYDVYDCVILSITVQSLV